jgi:ankyrin repeat protein
LAFYVPQEAPCPTPLLVACHENHPQVATYLISKGARVNYQNKVIHYLYYLLISLLTKVSPQNGSTSLHVASLNGHTAVVQPLIESQAKLNIKNHVSVELLLACMGMDS